MRNPFFHKALGSAICSAICSMPLLFGARASAQLTITFQSPVQILAAGSTITVDGRLTNTSSAALFLNGDSLVLGGSGLTVSDQPFLTGAPLSLAPAGTVGSTWTGDLFQVSADPSTVPDLYTGSFIIFGGADSLSGDTIAAPTFQVLVQPTPVPELPPSVSLGLLLVLGMGSLVRRGRPRPGEGRGRQ